jgi:hypothetical protein
MQIPNVIFSAAGQNVTFGREQISRSGFFFHFWVSQELKRPVASANPCAIESATSRHAINIYNRSQNTLYPPPFMIRAGY